MHDPAEDRPQTCVPQRWRLELGRTPRDCQVFLNDELLATVVSLKLEAGVDGQGHPHPTLLTLTLVPEALEVEVGPTFQEDMPNGLFREGDVNHGR